MGETKYQAMLVKKLREMFPGCEVMRNDPTRKQGMPDLLILFKGLWAMLEVKVSENAPVRENQPYWVDHYDKMGFARFVYPENEEQVLSDLQSALRPTRPTRLSKSK